ncbi:hypothetical protein Lal_00017609 [Lupinus albus]|nr:hypothetical protein Lal_00017609 [Lupinus albus]
MGSGISNINITKVDCGPGHGISIGSLGKNGEYATVENVYVSGCNFNGTTNGARIKTWTDGSGYVRNVTFEHITLINTKNPIIIDQNYQDIVLNEIKNEGSGIEISGVTYKNVIGTSASEVAIKLDCSSSKGCNNIFMDEISITKEYEAGSSMSQPTVICKNVHGEAGSVKPPVPCLKTISHSAN